MLLKMYISMVSDLKLLLGIESSETTYDLLLISLLNNCEQYFEDYTNTCFNTNDESMCNLIVQMAVEDYNRLGLEGLKEQSLAGTREVYTEGYSKRIKNRLISYKTLRCK